MDLKEATQLECALEVIKRCRNGLICKRDMSPASYHFIALGDRITELEAEVKRLEGQLLELNALIQDVY